MRTMIRFSILVLIFASCTTHKRQSHQSFISADSLHSYMEKVVNPMLQNHNSADAKRILDSLKPLVSNINEFHLTCSWMLFKIPQFIYDKEFDSAKYFVHQGLNLAVSQDSNAKEIAEFKLHYAEVLREQNQPDSALRYAKESYYLAKKKDSADLPFICYRLYLIYSAIGDIDDMRKYLFEGFHRADRPAFQTLFANGITEYYQNIGQVDSAIIFFKTVENDKSFGSDYFNGFRYENIAVLLTQQEKFNEALKYHLKAVPILKIFGGYDARVCLNIGITYHGLKQYDASNDYLDTAISLYPRENDLTLIRDIWEEKALNYQGENNYKLAYLAIDSAMENFQRDVDSSFIIQAKDLEAKYNLRTKDDQIKTLAITNKQNAKIRQQQRTIIIAMIVGVLLLSAIIVLLWKRRQAQMYFRQAELKQQLLRSQIGSHFIHNSLAVLQSLVRKSDEEAAINYLQTFSKLLRLSLENAEQGYVKLADEVQALERYLEVQSMNFEKRFTYAIQIYEGYETDNIMIPPMLIQPFVENSIVHGFTNAEEKGFIEVSISKAASSLQCRIDDNGVGLPIGGQLKQSSSLAIKIIKERLHILSKQTGKRTTLIISDRKYQDATSGVNVYVEIPYKKAHYV